MFVDVCEINISTDLCHLLMGFVLVLSMNVAESTIEFVIKFNIIVIHINIYNTINEDEGNNLMVCSSLAQKNNN